MIVLPLRLQTLILFQTEPSLESIWNYLATSQIQAQILFHNCNSKLIDQILEIYPAEIKTTLKTDALLSSNITTSIQSSL